MTGAVGVPGTKHGVAGHPHGAGLAFAHTETAADAGFGQDRDVLARAGQRLAERLAVPALGDLRAAGPEPEPQSPSEEHVSASSFAHSPRGGGWPHPLALAPGGPPELIVGFAYAWKKGALDWE